MVKTTGDDKFDRAPECVGTGARAVAVRWVTRRTNRTAENRGWPNPGLVTLGFVKQAPRRGHMVFIRAANRRREWLHTAVAASISVTDATLPPFLDLRANEGANNYAITE
jgi:hypothetical protein